MLVGALGCRTQTVSRVRTCGLGPSAAARVQQGGFPVPTLFADGATRAAKVNALPVGQVTAPRLLATPDVLILRKATRVFRSAAR